MDPKQTAAATDPGGHIVAEDHWQLVVSLLNSNAVNARWNPGKAGRFNRRAPQSARFAITVDARVVVVVPRPHYTAVHTHAHFRLRSGGKERQPLLPEAFEFFTFMAQVLYLVLRSSIWLEA